MKVYLNIFIITKKGEDHYLKLFLEVYNDDKTISLQRSKMELLLDHPVEAPILADKEISCRRFHAVCIGGRKTWTLENS